MAEKQVPLKVVPTRNVLPLIPVRNVVLFPSVETSLVFGRQESVNALLYAYDHTNKYCVITSQKSTKITNPKKEDLYEFGVLAKIENVLHTDENLHAVVRIISRVKITKFLQFEPHISVEFIDIPIPSEPLTNIQTSADFLLSQLKKAFASGRQFDLPAMMQLSTGVSSSDLADQVAYALNVKISEKQKILETLEVSKRLSACSQHLIQEISTAELEWDIEKKTQEKFNQTVKRNVLEERKHQIEKELRKLGKKTNTEFDNLELRIKKSKMPKDIKKKMVKEYDRLLEMGSMSPESGYIRTYLEAVVELPWGKYSLNNSKISDAEKILDEDHYGLEDAKDRILEYMSVMKLKEKNKTENTKTSNILCFVGPPGVGKTSIGKSIAKAMGREFIRASLGGIRDEAEIRGHRRTYVGAMAGRIIKSLKDVKSMNPVFMLDEVDKIGADYRGDPSAALLEVLDPEQNREFVDHYLDFPVDLSKVFFILTANTVNTIPNPLLDRLETIPFYGYTLDEKYHIAKRYLIKKELLSNGLKLENIVPFKDDTIKYIIDKYTREAGVRELQRIFATIFRKVARKIVSGKAKKVDVNHEKTIQKFLGPEKYIPLLRGKKDQIGVANGLAWTSVGGEMLLIEVNVMPGKGDLTLTGKLGTVMKESCTAALSFIRSQAKTFGITKKFDKIDIHIHFPEGATPKDGPSAGVTTTTALISALTNRTISRDIAMTGEITIRGTVLEIGGLKEKSIAAQRAGIKTVFIPKDNVRDLVKLPKEVKRDIKFIPVEHYLEIYKKVFKKKKV